MCKKSRYLSHIRFVQRNEKGKIIGVMGMSVPVNKNQKNEFDFTSLSPQQLNCFRLLIKGASIKEIASKLHLTYRTAEHYLKAVKAKLKCRSTNELIARYANQII